MPDLRVMRDRQAAAGQALDSAQGLAEAEGSPALLVTTTTVGTYPTSAGTFYAAIPTDINGAEVEGGAASYVTGTGVVYCLNLGSEIPPDGTVLIAEGVGGRLVFRFDG